MVEGQGHCYAFSNFNFSVWYKGSFIHNCDNTYSSRSSCIRTVNLRPVVSASNVYHQRSYSMDHKNQLELKTCGTLK